MELHPRRRVQDRLRHRPCSEPDHAAGRAAYGQFGAKIEIADGLAAVSAAHQRTGQESGGTLGGGAVYVLDVETMTILHELAPVGMTEGSWFGSALAMAGDTIAAGSSKLEAVYVFDAAAGTERFHVVNPDGVAWPDSDFGGHIAVGDGFLAVADTRRSADEVYAGGVHIFDAQTGAFVRTLTLPDAQAYDQFGRSPAIGGGRLAVIGRHHSPTGGTSDAVYLYDLATGAPEGMIRNIITAGATKSHVELSGDRLFASSVAGTFVHDLVSQRRVSLQANPALQLPGDFEPWSAAFDGDRMAVGSPMLAVGRGCVDLFTLPELPPCDADITGPALTGTPDGAVDASDLTYFLNEYVAGFGGPGFADITGPALDGVPDGVVDSSDLTHYLNIYVAQIGGGC